MLVSRGQLLCQQLHLAQKIKNPFYSGEVPEAAAFSLPLPYAAGYVIGGKTGSLLSIGTKAGDRERGGKYDYLNGNIDGLESALASHLLSSSTFTSPRLRRVYMSALLARQYDFSGIAREEAALRNSDLRFEAVREKAVSILEGAELQFGASHLVFVDEQFMDSTSDNRNLLRKGFATVWA